MKKTVGGVMKSLNKMVQQILKDQVAPYAISALEKQAQEDVYDVYQPKMYQRRNTLVQDEYYKATVVGTSLTVKNIAKTTDGKHLVSSVVVRGGPYDYVFPYNGVRRPFVENTAKKIMDNGDVARILRQNLPPELVG